MWSRIMRGYPSRGIAVSDRQGDLIYSDLSVFETLDLYVSSPGAMGIISKSVAHACSGGARGLLRPNDQEYGKGVVQIFTTIKRNQGCTFRNPRTKFGFFYAY